MIIAYAFVLVLSFFSIICFFVSWLIHLSQTLDGCKQYGWGSFTDFKEEFYNVEEWMHYDRWKWSLFYEGDSIEGKTKYHASIVVFDNKGMLLNPIAYIRSKLFIRNFIKNNFDITPKYNKDLWKV